MTPPAPRPDTVRLVFLGAAGVGKTALIRRFLHERFEHRYARTVEELHSLELDARTRLEILDTGGSYSFPAMRRLCMRRSDAFALVYAVDEPASFDEVRRLREQILEQRGGRAAPPITVVGCKADLHEAEGRALSAGDVMAVVEGEWGADFVEASARTGGNAAGVFRALLRHHVNVSSPQSSRRRRRGAPVKKSHGCVLS